MQHWAQLAAVLIAHVVEHQALPGVWGKCACTCLCVHVHVHVHVRMSVCVTVRKHGR
jgi:hypothetical protein